MSILVPTYRRTGSPLHAARAGVAGAWVAAPCVIALLYDHPLVLGAALVAVVLSGLLASLGAELGRAARFALPLALLVALVNPLVSREGLTVLVQGPVVPVLGRLDITLEALSYGAIAGMRVLVVMLAFALYSAAVDPDEVLRSLRRFSLRSSLTASIATRLVPMLGRDARRLSDAYSLRAARPAQGRRLERLRRGAILTRALAAGALERAVDMAAALEVRGYAATPRRGRATARAPWSRHDLAFAASALAVALPALAGMLAGVAAFDPYPTLHAELDLLVGALAVTVVASMLAPFATAALRRARLRRLDSTSPRPALARAGRAA
jgi:energy-coupling factor transport system permease protein